MGCRCCVDFTPRKVSAGDMPILTNMAEMVVRELEKDKRLQLQKLVRPCPTMVHGVEVWIQEQVDAPGTTVCLHLNSLGPLKDLVGELEKARRLQLRKLVRR